MTPTDDAPTVSSDAPNPLHEVLLYGMARRPEHEPLRPQDSNDAIVILTDDAGPRITRSFRIGTLEVAAVSGGRVDIEPLPVAHQWRGVVHGYVMAGELTVEQGGNSTLMRAGDFVFYTGAQRYRITSPARTSISCSASPPHPSRCDTRCSPTSSRWIYRRRHPRASSPACWRRWPLRPCVRPSPPPRTSGTPSSRHPTPSSRTRVRPDRRSRCHSSTPSCCGWRRTSPSRTCRPRVQPKLTSCRCATSAASSRRTGRPSRRLSGSAASSTSATSWWIPAGCANPSSRSPAAGGSQIPPFVSRAFTVQFGVSPRRYPALSPDAGAGWRTRLGGKRFRGRQRGNRVKHTARSPLDRACACAHCRADRRGGGPGGGRRIIPITAGVVDGPDLFGEVVALGADWNMVRADGAETVSARYLLRTHDDVVLSVTNEGVLTPGPDGRSGSRRSASRPRSTAPMPGSTTPCWSAVSRRWSRTRGRRGVVGVLVCAATTGVR